MTKRLLLAAICSLGISGTTVTAGDFLVTAATLRAVAGTYEGPCPTRIEFEGTITVNGRGTVTYNFPSSDGSTGRVYTLVCPRQGTYTIRFARDVGGNGSRSQFFGWSSVRTLTPNELRSNRANYQVNCVPEPPAPPSGVRTGRFRVTINGFWCSRPTFDDERQTDGVDDEVFIRGDAAVYDRTGRRRGAAVTAVSKVIGDTNGFLDRIRGGSGHSIFGGNGGFKETDTFPAGRPWERRSEPTRDRPPMIVWEGELRQSEAGLLIVPSIWEWDGDVSLEDDYAAALAGFWGDSEVVSCMARTIASSVGVSDPGFNPSILRRLFAGVRLSQPFPGNPKNRPIGMKKGRGEFHVYEPQALVLSYATASRIAGENRQYGRGAIVLSLADHDALRGLYQLYIQVERLP